MNNNSQARQSNVRGAKFAGTRFFRPTAMSIGLKDCGAIPGLHVIEERALVSVSAGRRVFY